MTLHCDLMIRDAAIFAIFYGTGAAEVFGLVDRGAVRLKPTLVAVHAGRLLTRNREAVAR
jgi:hypothetical protein